MVRRLEEMKSNLEKLDGSGVRLLLVSGSLMTIIFLAIGFAVTQLFCLLYWLITGVSLSWFAVFIAKAITLMAVRLGLFVVTELLTFTEFSRGGSDGDED